MKLKWQIIWHLNYKLLAGHKISSCSKLIIRTIECIKTELANGKIIYWLCTQFQECACKLLILSVWMTLVLFAEKILEKNPRFECLTSAEETLLMLYESVLLTKTDEKPEIIYHQFAFKKGTCPFLVACKMSVSSIHVLLTTCSYLCSIRRWCSAASLYNFHPRRYVYIKNFVQETAIL